MRSEWGTIIAGPVDQGQKALERVLAIAFAGVGVWGERFFVGDPFWGGGSFLGRCPFWENGEWGAEMQFRGVLSGRGSFGVQVSEGEVLSGGMGEERSFGGGGFPKQIQNRRRGDNGTRRVTAE